MMQMQNTAYEGLALAIAKLGASTSKMQQAFAELEAHHEKEKRLALIHASLYVFPTQCDTCMHAFHVCTD